MVARSTERFTRQILQLVPSPQLSWPPADVLRTAADQQDMWENCFNTQASWPLPPRNYRFDILKSLIRKIEAAVIDPEEDDISENLIGSLSSLLFEGIPTDLVAAQQKSWVSYVVAQRPHLPPIPPIRLLEQRAVISGHGTTGLRTWEAALHMATYVLTTQSAIKLFKDKIILELGSGTGFLSILACKLGARQVITTDGSVEVTEALRENLRVNLCGSQVIPGVLIWGASLEAGILQSSLNGRQLDTVMAADVTYDTSVIPALVATIRHLFEIWPNVKVLLSATIRDESTFAVFTRTCVSNELNIDEIKFPVANAEDQIDLFYSTATPLKIVRISTSESATGTLPLT